MTEIILDRQDKHTDRFDLQHIYCQGKKGVR